MGGVSPRRLALEVFLFFLLLYLLTGNGRIVNRDGEAMFQVARNIAEAGRFDTPAESVFEVSVGPRGTAGDSLSFATETAQRGADGRLYAVYGLGQSLVSIPFYYAGRLIAPAIPGVSPHFTTRFAVAALNAVVVALTCAVLLSFAYHLGFSLRASLLVTMIFGAATMAWPYAKSYASEPLTGLLLLLAAFCLMRSSPARRRQAWLATAGLALGFAVMVRISVVVLLPVFALYWLAIVLLPLPVAQGQGNENRTRLYSFLAFIAPLVVVMAAMGWYNYARFGTPTVTGYQSIAWNRPFVEGLYGLLFSPGKGLIWYNPVLVVSLVAFAAFFRWRKREAVFLAGLSLVWLAFHAPYRFWEGGWSWGPRLMLPVLPFLVLPVAALGLRPGFLQRAGTRLLPAAIVLGLAVQVLGVGVDYTRYLWATYSSNPDEMYVRVVNQISGSPLVGQWVELAAVVGNASRQGELAAARAEIAAKTAKWKLDGLSETETSAAVLSETQLAGLNFPDFWFVYLYLFGAPLAFVVSAMTVIFAGAVVMLVVLDRRLRALETEKGLVQLA